MHAARYLGCRIVMVVMLVVLLVGSGSAPGQAKAERGQPAVWGASRTAHRQMRVVVACDPLDLDITVYPMADGKQRLMMNFGQVVLPEKDREAYLVGMTATRVVYDQKQATQIGLNDEQVAALRKLVGKYGAATGEEGWRGKVETQYHAWESTANEADRAKAAGDLVAMVKEAGAGVIARSVEFNLKRLEAIAELLTEKQMAELKKMSLAPENNWLRSYGLYRPQRLKEGVWRCEYSYLVISTINMTGNRINGKLVGFSATPTVRYDTELYSLENSLTWLASHPEQATALGVTRRQIGELRSTAMEMYGARIDAAGMARLRGAFDAWDQATEGAKKELEVALQALAGELSEGAAKRYSQAAKVRVEEIRAAIGVERLEKVTKMMTEEQYSRSAVDYGEFARP